MISIHFDESPVVDFKSAAKGDNELLKSFFMVCCKPVFKAPSAYESWFITTLCI
jgi:glutamate-1-semialdehyde 2,1-aminomutase